MGDLSKLETLLLSFVTPEVVLITLNRPNKLNAMSRVMYSEIKLVFDHFSKDPVVRCLVITGNTRSFCAGMDLNDGSSYNSDDPARSALRAQEDIKTLQDCITSAELCRKPVIAAVSGYCIGAGVDLITACCIRYCSKNAVISVREILLGLAADVGTLERLPKIVGNESWVKEIVYTGRDVKAEEALKHGLFSKMFENHEDTVKGAVELAKSIAEKSPVAMIGSKVNLNYSRDHSVTESLDFIVKWNGWALQTKDLNDSIAAMIQKKKATYPKL